MTRYTYKHLIELVEGDDELITHLVEEGIIECRDDERAMVDIDNVLVARTLWRDLEVEWSGIALILRLRDELAAARLRIAELEAELAKR